MRRESTALRAHPSSLTSTECHSELLEMALSVSSEFKQQLSHVSFLLFCEWISAAQWQSTVDSSERRGTVRSDDFNPTIVTTYLTFPFKIVSGVTLVESTRES